MKVLIKADLNERIFLIFICKKKLMISHLRSLYLLIPFGRLVQPQLVVTANFQYYENPNTMK